MERPESWKQSSSQDYRLFDRLAEDFEKEELKEGESFPLYSDLKTNAHRYGKPELLAKGGMKSIHQVMDFQTGRPVAMAVLHEGAPKEMVEPFLREAFLTAKLEHPNIITVHDVGLDHHELPYFTMELKNGDNLQQTLEKILKEGQQNLTQRRQFLLGLFIKICDGVSFAHSKKVLHLDLKLDNIQVGCHGEVLVCDWGLGKIIGEDDDGLDELLLNPDLLNNMTLAGDIKGTPGFMAPEQVQEDGQHGETTDIYSLGAILHTVLTGAPPFKGDTKDLLRQTSELGCPQNIDDDFTKKGIPASLTAVVKKACQLKPEERYRKVEELVQDIQNFLDGKATAAENPSSLKLLQLFIKRQLALSLTIVCSVIILLTALGLFITELQHKEELARQAKNEAQATLLRYMESNLKVQTLNKNYIAEQLQRHLELKRNHRFDEALTILIKLIEDYPDNIELWLPRAKLCLSMMDFQGALNCYRACQYNGPLLFIAEHFCHKKLDDPWSATEFDLLFSSIKDVWLKVRMIQSHGKANTHQKSEHALMIHRFMLNLNPNWKNGLFKYDPKQRRLTIGGTGLSQFCPSKKTKLIQWLGVYQLVLEATKDLSLNHLTALNLGCLDIHRSAIDDVEDLISISAIGKLIVSPSQEAQLPRVLKNCIEIEVINGLHQ